MGWGNAFLGLIETGKLNNKARVRSFIVFPPGSYLIATAHLVNLGKPAGLRLLVIY
jgi:hypothetical protein